jgi:hypothetical protein
LVYNELRFSSLAPTYPDAYVFKFDVKKNNNDVLVRRTHPKRYLNTTNMGLYFDRILETL